MSFQRLGWNAMHVLLQHVQSRLEFGVHADLVDLMRLSAMDARTARLFHAAGLTGVLQVTRCTAKFQNDGPSGLIDDGVVLFFSARWPQRRSTTSS